MGCREIHVDCDDLAGKRLPEPNDPPPVLDENVEHALPFAHVSARPFDVDARPTERFARAQERSGLVQEPYRQIRDHRRLLRISEIARTLAEPDERTDSAGLRRAEPVQSRLQLATIGGGASNVCRTTQ